MASELGGEERLAVGDARFGALGLEAGITEGLLVALHDHRGMLRIELVGVDLEDAVLVLADGEREGFEALRRSQPHVTAAAQIDARLEGRGVALAGAAVGTVGRDHEIAVAQLLDIVDLLAEAELGAELGGTL